MFVFHMCVCMRCVNISRSHRSNHMKWHTHTKSCRIEQRNFCGTVQFAVCLCVCFHDWFCQWSSSWLFCERVGIAEYSKINVSENKYNTHVNCFVGYENGGFDRPEMAVQKPCVGSMLREPCNASLPHSHSYERTHTYPQSHSQSYILMYAYFFFFHSFL